ncbi:MAG: cell wall assembly/cell proliferation coordinating protein, KNR4-like protein [Lachnospiraceae bacterium]|nr:cell wall assembly/cell proliferation coordinating protein, KNR4-like protein [Lachnospiraceae bacterium]
MDIINAFLRRKNVLHGTKHTDNEVHSLEKKLGICFSSDYKTYLLEYGTVAYEGHELTGISNSKRLNVVDATERENCDRKQVINNMYVIECANIDGIVFWQAEDGKIYRTDYDSEPQFVCDSLSDYVANY